MSEVNKETLQNSMQANYKISLPPVKHVFSNSLTEIHIHKTAETVKPVNISSGIGEEKRVPVELNIQENSNIPVTIGIPYRNCMSSVFNTQEPDKLITHIPSDMDSYTDQQPPNHIENYGHISAMHVKGGKYERHSLVYFHLPLWFLEVVSISTKLRLYYRGGFTDNEQLTLHTVDTQWFEYGVTSANEPYINHTVSSNYIRNKEEGYIEFDVTNLIDIWKNFPERNNGFVLTSKNDTLLKFFTRETLFKPLLVAEYYDPMIKSFGRSNQSVELTVRQGGKEDITVDIEPNTKFGEIDKLVNIMPYTRGDTIWEQKEVTITSNVKNRFAEISIARLAEEDKEVIIQPKLEGHDITNVQLNITRDENEVEITAGIGAQDDKWVVIEPQVIDIDKEVIIQPIFSEDKDSEAQLAISRENTEVELEVLERSNIDVEISSSIADDKEVNLAVKREQISVETFVYYNSDKEVHIHAKGWEKDDDLVDLSVTREQIKTELEVIYASDKEVNIHAKGYTDNDKNTQLYVSRQNAYVEILTKAILSDKDVEIYVANTNDKEAIIRVLEQSNINVELSSTIANDNKAIITVPILDWFDKEVNIAVSREQTNVQIGVYFHEVSEPLVQIQPLVRRTSNMEVEIRAGGDIVGYAFIM